MRRCRDGYSLVEMLVVLTLAGTLLGTVSVTVAGLFRAERTMRDGLARDRDLERFSAQFRSDVHQAASGTLGQGDAAGELTLQGPDARTTRYTIESQKIQRVVARGEAIVQRETYGLAAQGWEIDQDNGAPIVSAQLPNGIRIDAVVNLGRQAR